MKKRVDNSSDAAVLRRMAEARLYKSHEKNVLPTSKEDLLRLVQELQIHQIELEMVNEELQETRNAVEKGLEQYTELYNFAPLGYFTLNRSGDICMANLTGAHMLGVDRSELIGGRFGLFVSIKNRTDFCNFLQKVFESNTKENCETMLIKKNGEQCYVRIDAVAATEWQGCKIAVVDITEQKAIESQLEAYHLYLEDMVKVRTKGLEEANKELESFSYSVSHDLRAPLRAIGGYSHFLQRDHYDRLDDDGKRLIDTIIKSISKMGQLVSDLLTFSRLSKLNINNATIDMKSVVNTVYNEVATDDEKKEFEFIVDDIPDARGDVSAVVQIWSNLIGNELKYSGKSKTKSITIGSIEKDHVPAYFIKDCGVGFNPDYKHKLFEVFERLHSEEEFSGTGIGLAIVKRLVDLHGGTVWAESQVNDGATFYFVLQP